MESNILQQFIITEDKDFTPSVTFVGATAMASDLNLDFPSNGELTFDSVDDDGTIILTITERSIQLRNRIDQPINSDTSSIEGEQGDFTSSSPSELSFSELYFDGPASDFERNRSFSSAMMPFSPPPSKTPPALFEGYLSSEEHLNAVSPAKIFVAGKKKRGRKPKSQTGVSCPTKKKRLKAYEITEPFADKEMEKKRLNAINAKKHRDMHRQSKELLNKQLEEVIEERDILKKEVEALKKREELLLQQVDKFKKLAISLQSVFQNGQ